MENNHEQTGSFPSFPLIIFLHVLDPRYSTCPAMTLAGNKVVGAFELVGPVGTCLAVETATLMLPSLGFLSVFFGLGRQ